MPAEAQQVKNVAYSTKHIPITGTEEIISYELYSYLPVTSSTTDLTFFGYAIGQVVPGSSTRATKKWTNLTQPNTLPAPYRFTVKEISCDVLPNVSTVANGNWASDYLKLILDGYFEFEIGAKTYWDGRLSKLVPKYRPMGVASVSTTASSTTIQRELIGLSGESYKIKPDGMTLIPGLSFSVRVKWDSAPSISTDAVLGIILWGYLVRPAQ